MLKLDNVHKWFGSLHVLKGVSFDVSRGQVTVIIGRSGSGKSTILPVSYTHLTLPTNREV